MHDSDDDWEYDELSERDKAFFANEEAIRNSTKVNFMKSLALESTELVSAKKRKGDNLRYYSVVVRALRMIIMVSYQM